MNDTINLVDIARVSVNTHQPSITLSSSWLVLCVVVIIIFLLIIVKWFLLKNSKLRWQTLEIEISGTPKATFKVERNYENLYIANRIYIELITRKAAIPLDEENDIIEEVYDSWYKLFNIIREEIKSVPGKYLHDHDATQSLIGLTRTILNEGLRPHLTKYHAKYRKWLKENIDKPENANKTPQEIQKKYSEYNELVKSMKEVNKLLIDYSIELDKLIRK